MTKRRVRLKNQACPGCGQIGSLKRILYGLPGENFDFSKYIVGGCIVTERDPDVGCVKCDWQGARKEIL